MIELELDGKQVFTEAGSTILEVAIKEGKYIPHFCYHKKLSIAANCRMCLVEVAKSNKPLPACATPVTEGMKIQTCSEIAVNAQKGVMEFLLINHPLDCPICDQGGECQLQDLAVGYGKSHSRYTENKRVVSDKDIGPLIETEMTRCIHCSRCIRFTDEIAGYQELGMSYRNNHVEVMTFIGKTVDSEISGNIIDLCPVGALTSKPFRNQARSWELSRRKTISPHDSLGSNLIAQVDKYHKVVRILPYENEALNECWISDRDRFSYQGLYHTDRITSPMIKQDNQWIKVDWNTALQYAAKSISGVIADHGVDNIGVLGNANSTVEELYLLQKMMRSLGVINIDHRLTQVDFRLDKITNGYQALGDNLNVVLSSPAILIIGSVLRQEQPLIASKIRQKIKHNQLQLNIINFIQEDLLCSTHSQIITDPRNIVYYLSQLINLSNNLDITDNENDKILVSMFNSIKNNGYIILGDGIRMQKNYAQIVLLTQELAKNLKIKYGFLLAKANELGAQAVGFIPYQGSFGQALANSGQNTEEILKHNKKAYILFNTELELDTANSHLTLNALNQVATNVVFTSFVNENMKSYADVILPITPFTETAGSYINLEGIWQKFNGVTKPLGESRPGWKVIRALANIVGLNEFIYDDIEQVRNELIELNNIKTNINHQFNLQVKLVEQLPELKTVMRVGLQNMYNTDSLTRRAIALQQTKLANSSQLTISNKLMNKLGIIMNETIKLKQNSFIRKFTPVIDDTLPDTVLALTVNEYSCGLGARFDTIEVVA